MNNFEALKALNREQLEIILDQIFLAGMNTGIHISTLSDDNESDSWDKTPFDAEWLSSPAEEVFTAMLRNDEDDYLLDALTKSILLAAGIDEEPTPAESHSSEYLEKHAAAENGDVSAMLWLGNAKILMSYSILPFWAISSLPPALKTNTLLLMACWVTLSLPGCWVPQT